MTNNDSVPQRIAGLRAALRSHGADACIVPSSDPHVSEYLPRRWQSREWLSGFSGSMGTLVVTLEQAALFADQRYWEQAERELAGSGIALEKIGSSAGAQHVDWVAHHLKPGATVSVDGQVLSLAAEQQLRSGLEAAGIGLRLDLDLVEEVWTDRPAVPPTAVFEHDPGYAIQSRAAKLAAVRTGMAQHGASHHLVSSLDDIAWITNLRGADVDYNPVFVAFLLVDAARARLFVDPGKLPGDLAARLRAEQIEVFDYGLVGAALVDLPPDAVLLIDSKRSTAGLRNRVPAAVKVVQAINPSTLLKSRKNTQEAEFVREAMIEDGAAMCEFYAWLEPRLGRERITELTIDEQLSAARARRQGFMGLSFSTIAGFNANGAMPHYRATPELHAVIEGNGLLLIDSGGQYLGGTTDITRVWPIGTINAAQRRDFTAVLKGTMALSRTRFPRGTLSPVLDSIARAPLWAEGLDYLHGTGHGVGYFLNVHEGPQTISRAIPDATMAMEPGMITSIEPGVYRQGQWGVRIENLVLNVPAASSEGSTFGEWLEFETLTLCPIDTRCLDLAMLREDEREWLNGYHQMVRERLAPRVSGDALAWLNTRTAAI